jgi:hypothetical protein
VAPVLTVPGNQTIAEQTTLNVSASASDADLPANTLTFALVSFPAGMSIDPNTGAISWTPGEAQGPSTNGVSVSVTDNGVPPLSVTNSFEVVVSEVNVAPVLTVPGNQTIAEQTTLNVSASASDADLPTNTLTFALVSFPAGMSIDPNTGAISWTPGEAQGPSTNGVSVSVSDNGVPPLSVTNSFEVIVTEVNFVVGRHIFYNDSLFDGNDAGANAGDDGAMATDKTALLPGQTASFANYTSYSRGINGIMVDITLLPGVPGVGDFTFRVGNDNDPGGWVAAPAPLSVTVRSGAGTGGSDRVTILWADNAIQKEWLQVIVGATAATGLGSPDVFYFGNAVGESGNSASDARVNATDEILARNNPRALGQAPVDFAYDYNRDGKVNATDEIIARNNPTSSLTALQLISVPGISGGGASGPLRLQSAVVPVVLRISSIAVAENDTLKVQFSGLSGGLYRLQSADDVGRGVWQDVSPEPSLQKLSNNLYEFEVKKPAAARAQFYRIVSQ